MKIFFSTRYFHALLLLIWITIGSALRFAQLTQKSPWTDEFATMVFSLGNSYQTVPLDQAISLSTLLKPLQFDQTIGVSAVLRHLLTEDHHPPLYFLLTHWWIKLLPASGEYVSLWVVRSLPALLGVISIPAVYLLGWLAFRGRWSHPNPLAPLAAQLAAAMMAVSPYGIFLAQEARHYTCAIIWVIASLCCLVVTIEHLQQRKLLPIIVILCWVTVNSLGIATHYLFCLTLCAEAIVFISLGSWVGIFSRPLSYWWRIAAVIVGTLIGCLVWLPVWQASYDPQMTQWIMTNASEVGGNSFVHTALGLLSPIFQFLATWITMFSLLPVEASALPVVVASVLVMVLFFFWAVPLFSSNLKTLLRKAETRLSTAVLSVFVLAAIAIFFVLTYFLGTDLTRGARYSFVYFPAVMVLGGATFAINWKTSNSAQSKPRKDREALTQIDSLLFRFKGKSAVGLILLMGLLSGITVVSNLGYQKYYRPDLLLQKMQHLSSEQVLIATTHNTLVQTGEMMGIAWEFKRTASINKTPISPWFLLAHQDQVRCPETTCPATTILQETLAPLPRPLDLWLVNFQAPVEEKDINCLASRDQITVDGYQSQLYRCLD